MNNSMHAANAILNLEYDRASSSFKSNVMSDLDRTFILYLFISLAHQYADTNLYKYPPLIY